MRFWLHGYTPRLFREGSLSVPEKESSPLGTVCPHEDTPKDGSGEQPWRQRETPSPAHMQAGLPPAWGSEPTCHPCPTPCYSVWGAGQGRTCPKSLQDSLAAEKPSVCLLGKSVTAKNNKCIVAAAPPWVASTGWSLPASTRPQGSGPGAGHCRLALPTGPAAPHPCGFAAFSHENWELVTDESFGTVNRGTAPSVGRPCPLPTHSAPGALQCDNHRRPRYCPVSPRAIGSPVWEPWASRASRGHLCPPKVSSLCCPEMLTEGLIWGKWPRLAQGRREGFS